MNEPNEIPTPSPKETAISPQILEKFSKRDIPLDQQMQIKGEGELYISVEPENPLYIAFQEDRNIIQRYIKTLHERGHRGDKVMDDALDTMRKDQELFERGIQKIHTTRYIHEKQEGFLRRSKEIPRDGSPESIKREQELASEVDEFNDLIDYMKYLVGQNAVKIILPQEDPNKKQTKLKQG